MGSEEPSRLLVTDEVGSPTELPDETEWYRSAECEPYSEASSEDGFEVLDGSDLAVNLEQIPGDREQAEQNIPPDLEVGSTSSSQKTLSQMNLGFLDDATGASTDQPLNRFLSFDLVDDAEIQFIKQQFSNSAEGLGLLAREFMDLPQPKVDQSLSAESLARTPAFDLLTGFEQATSLGTRKRNIRDPDSDDEDLLYRDKEAGAGSELKYNADQYETLLNQAVKGIKSSVPKPVWEQDLWTQSVVGAVPSFLDYVVTEPKLVPMPPIQKPESTPPQHSTAFSSDLPAMKVASASRKSWVVDVEERKQVMVASLKSFVDINPLSSILGRQIRGLTDDQQLLAVHDAVRTKSVNTVKQRLSSMFQYERFIAKRRSGPCYPFYESEVYEYVDHLRSVWAPATRASRFMEAVRFMHYVIGVDLEQEIFKSRRVDGAVFSSTERKRMLLQRDVLTVDMVRCLEQWLVEKGHEDPARANVVGGHLFCMHTRSRWGDINAVNAEPTIDGPWVDAATAYHKTYNRPERRHRWLPLAGLADGVSGLGWAKAWLEIRKALGLQAKDGEPFIPLANGDGSWSQVRVTSSESTEVLREVLASMGTPKEKLVNVGTHSLKATLLSWCAKAGLAMDDRRLLGNHINRKDISVLTYSRDTLSAPLRRLKYVVDCVREGTFDPDSSKSGMWLRKSQASSSSSGPVGLDAAGFMEPKVVPKSSGAAPANFASRLDLDAELALAELAGDQLRANKNFVQRFPEEIFRPVVLGSAEDGQEDGASSPSEEESTDEDKAERIIVQRAREMGVGRAPASLADESLVFKHVKYGTFHYGKIGQPFELACGRAVSDRYEAARSGAIITLPRCRVCFGSDNPELQDE